MPQIIRLKQNIAVFMKINGIKHVWLLWIVCFCLTACHGIDEATMITDDDGDVHYMPHHLKDMRGRDHFPLQVKPRGRKVFVFDPKVSAWAAYNEQGERVMTGMGSGGADYCDDVNESCRTITGTFRIYHKRGAGCKSSKYPVETAGGAKMPYCMYFYRGFTIHAGYEKLTTNASHGCIRILPSAAKWLNEEFVTVGRTDVVVLSYDHEDGDGDWLREAAL